MNKSLLALATLAVLATLAEPAAAQSSVTLYGTLDLSTRYVKNEGAPRRVSLSQDGIGASQLGFKGSEDLGGGLQASFLLLAGVNGDVGSANPKFWNRRSTVSLSGPFGEIRLGRDWVPTFWNDAIFDPFAATGVANEFNIHQTNQLGTYLRTDNTVGYFLPPDLGGVYGQLMVAAGEGAATSPGRYIGGRLGYTAGPVNIAASYGATRLDLTPTQPDQKSMSVGAWYDFGAIKLTGFYTRETLAYQAVDNRESRFYLGAWIPVGEAGQVRIAAGRSKLSTVSYGNTVSQVGLGYVHNLSKRTSLYAIAARLSNGSRSQLTVSGGIPAYAGAAVGALPILGGNSSGADLGIRHNF